MFGKTDPFNSEAEMLGENRDTNTVVNGAFRKQYNKIISPREDGQIPGRTPSIERNSPQTEVKNLNRFRDISSNFYEQRHKFSMLRLSENDKLNYEFARLDTFYDYAPCHANYYGPLAQAGFYCDSGRTIRCAICKIPYCQWNLDEEYCRYAMRCLNPECKGITSENIPLTLREASIGDSRQEREHQQQHHHPEGLLSLRDGRQQQQEQQQGMRDRRPQHKTTEAYKDQEASSPDKILKESVVIETPQVLTHKCNELTERNGTQKKEKQNLREEIDRLRENDSIKNMMLQQRKDEIDKSQTQLEDETKNTQELAKQRCHLKSKLGTCSQDIQMNIKENRGLKDRIRKLERDLSNAVKEIQDGSEKKDKLLRKVKDTAKELEDTKRNKQWLERDFTDYRHKNRQKQNDLKLKLKESKKKYEDIKEQLHCKICLDNNVSVVFLPCGHANCCEACTIQLYQYGTNRCPVCRHVVDKCYKIFLS